MPHKRAGKIATCLTLIFTSAALATGCNAFSDDNTPRGCAPREYSQTEIMQKDPLIVEAEQVLAKEGAAIAALVGRPANFANCITFRVKDGPGIASASASGGVVRITLFKPYFAEYPDDLPGVVIHELVHAIQRGKTNKGDFGWMTEGLADFVRYKLGYGSMEGGDPLKSNKVAAAFFNWMYELPDGHKTYYAFVKALTEGVRPSSVDSLLQQYNDGRQPHSPKPSRPGP